MARQWNLNHLHGSVANRILDRHEAKQNPITISIPVRQNTPPTQSEPKPSVLGRIVDMSGHLFKDMA